MSNNLIRFKISTLTWTFSHHFVRLTWACMHRTVATFMRRSVRVVLSSMLRLSWLRSLSWASCSWSSERRKASGRGSSSASRPSSSLRTWSISCSSSPRTAWASRSAWASRAQYSSASARVFPTCSVLVNREGNWVQTLHEHSKNLFCYHNLLLSS